MATLLIFLLKFLVILGAEIFSVETVPVRMNTGAQQRYGPEATLVWSQPEPGVKFEDWLLFVRSVSLNTYVTIAIIYIYI